MDLSTQWARNVAAGKKSVSVGNARKLSPPFRRPLHPTAQRWAMYVVSRKGAASGRKLIDPADETDGWRFEQEFLASGYGEMKLTGRA